MIENGIVPNDGLYWDLKMRSLNRGQTDIDALYDAQPQPSLTALDAHPGQFLLFRVGDCISMHNIHAAIYDSLRLVKDFLRMRPIADQSGFAVLTCSARSGLQAGTASQARRMRLESPATPPSLFLRERAQHKTSCRP